MLSKYFSPVTTLPSTLMHPDASSEMKGRTTKQRILTNENSTRTALKLIQESSNLWALDDVMFMQTSP